MISYEELVNRFSFHPPADEETRNRYTNIRLKCLQVAEFINDNVPEGREKALAFTNLEQTMMWANKGIANSRPQDAVHPKD